MHSAGGMLVEAADRSRPRGGTVARGKCRVVVSTPPAGSRQHAASIESR
jgi:hypothetical protein